MLPLADMTRAEVAALVWQVQPEPILSPPFPSPVIADPTFLPPTHTTNGSWRLWAHSLLGLHSYSSDDGVDWKRGDTVTRNALRAQILDLQSAPGAWSNRPDRYRLSYEKTRLFLPLGIRWKSWIETRRSTDLEHWSDPTILLHPSLPWHTDIKLGDAVGNPCLVPLADGSWRLYYSAGLTLLPDCGFPEPTYIGVAHGPSPDGPFRSERKPLLGPHDGPASLAAGAMKVLRVADGWIAFQNAITWDGTHSGSEIWVLGSDDGLLWRQLSRTAAIAPSGDGWMSTHVYALDVRDSPSGPRLYFNARDGYHWTKGRERIGYATI